MTYQSMSELLGEDLAKFYEEHDADAKGVYLVEVYTPDGELDGLGVFTRHDLAQQWLANQKDENSCCVIPFMLDDPKWGNEEDGSVPPMPRLN